MWLLELSPFVRSFYPDHFSESFKETVLKCPIMIDNKLKIGKCKKHHSVWLILISSLCHVFILSITSEILEGSSENIKRQRTIR